VRKNIVRKTYQTKKQMQNISNTHEKVEDDDEEEEEEWIQQGVKHRKYVYIQFLLDRMYVFDLAKHHTPVFSTEVLITNSGSININTSGQPVKF
jgi:hypothetical protein